MSIHLGIDIGSVSIKLAGLATGSDRKSLESVAASEGWGFRLEPRRGTEPIGLLTSSYQRILGAPVAALAELLRPVLSVIAAGRPVGLRITGSGGSFVAEGLGSPFENEYRALARGLRWLHPEVRSVMEIGGGSSSFLQLSADGDERNLGILDYRTNGECAAGTGSFIDQQASRLLYKVEDIGPAASGASCAARIAGRCSVFAKSDMIHAQQKGYTSDQILRGLCDAVARNYKSTVAGSRDVRTPVAFLGGVASNEAVVKALAECFRLSKDELVVPSLHCWMGAIGAALADLESPTRFGRERLSVLAAVALPGDAAQQAPLGMDKVLFLRDVVEKAARIGDSGCRSKAFLGIDIGSVSTNLVVIDADGNLLKEIYLRTQGRPIQVVSAGLREIEEQLADKIEICGVGTTGSGRELIGELVGADVVNDEITAHKTGSVHVCRELGLEDVDTIFEIGGQDSKFIRIENGVVVDFTMNEACAAGTGSFLEEQAEKLGVEIKGEFAKLALASKAPARVGERCTVFMERDLTGHLLQGAGVGDLCAGLAYSVALNYLNRVVRGRKIGNVIFFQGGTAYNDAVAAAFSQILGKRIIVPPHNGVIGAIGMALRARDHMQDTVETRFRGYDLQQVNFTTRDFTCHACSNTCEMKEFVIAGERSYWGDKCSDKFRKRARSAGSPSIPDLFAYRQQALESFLEKPKGNRPKIGIPRAMFFYDRFPFWCTYLQDLGCDVVVSPATDGKIAAAGIGLSVSQPCFPIQVAHGHIRALLDSDIDYVLLPNICDAEGDLSRETYLCPWNQTLPFMVKAAAGIEPEAHRLLTPTVHFRLTPVAVAKQLHAVAKQLGFSRSVSDRAAGSAFFAQDAFRVRLQDKGAVVLEALERSGDRALVLVGRPYNIYDPTINCDIPRKLRSMFGVNVVPLDFLPFEAEEITDINPNMYWISGQRILRAARFTSRYPNLHLIYISNFKCGPDSYIKPYLSDAATRPGLVLQFDGHSNDAGFVTRCEAYLHSKGFLQ